MRPARLGPPETAASVRTIPLPQVVVDALAAHMAEQPTGVDGMLFTSGPRILNRYHLGKAFRRAARETLDTYSHLWPGFEDLTRAAVDSVLGAAADSLRTDSHGS